VASCQSPPRPIALSLSVSFPSFSHARSPERLRTPPCRCFFPATLDPLQRRRGGVQVRLVAPYNSLQFDLPLAAASPHPCLRNPSADQTDLAAVGLPCRSPWCCHGPPHPCRPPRRLWNGNAGLQPRRLLHSSYSRCCCHGGIGDGVVMTSWPFPCSRAPGVEADGWRRWWWWCCWWSSLHP
jgi:hypothetical protein